jgi:hypothetical protein
MAIDMRASYICALTFHTRLLLAKGGFACLTFYSSYRY